MRLLEIMKSKHPDKNSAGLLAAIVSLTIWLFSIPYYQMVFSGISRTIVFFKIIQLPVLFVFINEIFALLEKIKSKQLSIIIVYIWGAIFLIHVVFWLLIFPGSWRLDEPAIYNVMIKSRSVEYWQGYLTTAFYMLCVLTFPSPATIILVQIILISSICTYIFWNFSLFLKRKNLIFLFLLIFLVPPIMDTNLFPLRAALHSYMEILLIFLIFVYKIRKKTWSWKSILFLAFLTGIVSTWRSEAVYYMLAIPILFIIIFWKEVSLYRKLSVTFIIIIVSGVIMAPQLCHKMSQYELVAIVRPLIPLANRAVEKDDTEMIKEIDECFDINVLKKAYVDGIDGETMYYNQADYPFVRDGFNGSKMDNFKKAYIKLILKYPFTFVKERWCCFYNCVTKYSGTKTSELYTYNHDDLVYFREHYWLNQPINLEIRNHVVNYLEMKGLFACLKVLSIFIPQIIIVIGLNLYILLKNKLLFLAVLVYDLRIFLVFLTAPSWWHMYYYSVYTLGWMVGVGVIITLVDWIMNRFTMNKNVARSVKSGS